MTHVEPQKELYHRGVMHCTTGKGEITLFIFLSFWRGTRFMLLRGKDVEEDEVHVNTRARTAKVQEV